MQIKKDIKDVIITVSILALVIYFVKIHILPLRPTVIIFSTSFILHLFVYILKKTKKKIDFPKN
ncbi:hypothetical protein EV214_10775 [Marinisporobacter balticus]|uniref:Uncharacterized protein n=1 Tax=Marinisporobacter balticus TaxID=2018667 RepID=A0A4R2L2X9_9FIRM|nr:hypothetical protein EV214_10775 [Marinisporobacter balticus]